MKRVLLYRSDIRRKYDKATRTTYLVCTNDRISFFEDLYGLPEGSFFGVMHDDVPYPDDLRAMAAQAGVALHELVEGRQLQEGVVDALIASAMVDAPKHLADVADPPTYWADHDLYVLERKHRESVARVMTLRRVVEGQLRLRATIRGVPFTPVAPPVVEVVTSEVEEPEVREVQIEGDFETYAPTARVVEEAVEAAKAAREAELPQRLPAGARRQLSRMPPAAYVIRGDVIEPRVDLCGAMADAQAVGRKGAEAAVVDWDGEWPVVVRRYGADGRTVYKVETALRRHGVAS